MPVNADRLLSWQVQVAPRDLHALWLKDLYIFSGSASTMYSLHSTEAAVERRG